MTGPAELRPQERALVEAAVTGRLLDLRGGPDRIRAEVLTDLLTGRPDLLAGRPLRAVRVRGARVLESINLGGATIGCPVELYDCDLWRVCVAKATIPNLSLRGSRLHTRLSARLLKVAGSLNLSQGFRCPAVDVREARVGGQLELSRATLDRPGGEALMADGVVVGTDVYLLDARVAGEVRLWAARLGGGLDLSGARLRNPGGPAVSANLLVAPDGIALDAVGLRVGRDVILQGDCVVEGEARLSDAHLGADLEVSDTELRNPGRHALNLHQTTVTGSAALLDGTPCRNRTSSWPAPIAGRATSGPPGRSRSAASGCGGRR